MALGAVVSTLCGGAAGLLGSTMPHVLDLVRTHYDRCHEIKLKELERDTAQAHAMEEMAEATQALRTSVATQESEPPVDTTLESACPTQCWIAGLSALVRPVITYSFFGLFMAVKLVGLWVLMKYQHLDVASALDQIWDDNAQVTFVAVIAFWFGQRSLARFEGQ